MGKILRSKPIERVCKDQVFTKMTTTDLDIDTLANKGKIIIYHGQNPSILKNASFCVNEKNSDVLEICGIQDYFSVQGNARDQNLQSGKWHKIFFSLIAYISKYIRQRKVDNHNNRESA